MVTVVVDVNATFFIFVYCCYCFRLLCCCVSRDVFVADYFEAGMCQTSSSRKPNLYFPNMQICDKKNVFPKYPNLFYFYMF